MLDTIPYADLLAIYNAIAEKPVTRFDTRANGIRRTEALLEAHGLSLPEAARLADVVLEDTRSGDIAARDTLSGEDADSNKHKADAGLDAYAASDQTMTIPVDAAIASLVEAFVRELSKPERSAYVTAFLRRLERGGAAPTNNTTKRVSGMTHSQRTIIELCCRTEGATGKEMAEGCGWPSIAARATCQKLADRFDYDLNESPKANGRGISFRMTMKPAREQQA
jgi:hypothetical protein